LFSFLYFHPSLALHISHFVVPFLTDLFILVLFAILCQSSCLLQYPVILFYYYFLSFTLFFIACIW
jgi:hypothetical protein